MAMGIDRNKYKNPDMPVGYVKKNPILQFLEGVEIDGVHYIWAPILFEAKLEARKDYSQLSDFAPTEDEDCRIDYDSNTKKKRLVYIKQEPDENGKHGKKHCKRGKKGHGSDIDASHMDVESEKRVKKKKLKKVKKEKGGYDRISSSPESHTRHSPESHTRHSPTSSTRGRRIVTYSMSPSPPPEEYVAVKIKQEHVEERKKLKKHRKERKDYRSGSGSPYSSPPSSSRHIKVEGRTPTPPPEPFEPYDDGYLDVKVKQEPLEGPGHLFGAYFCDTCNLTLNSLVTYNTHMSGKKHRKMVKLKTGGLPATVAKTIPNAPALPEDESKYPRPLPGIRRIKVPEPSQIQHLITDYIRTPCPGLNNVIEIRGITQVQYYCSMCDSLCSPNCIISHLRGFKHMLRSVKQFKPGNYEQMQYEPKHKIENEILRILKAVEKQHGRGRIAVEIEELSNEPMDKKNIKNQPSTSRERDHSDESWNQPSTSRGMGGYSTSMSFAEQYDKATVPDMSASDYFCKMCQSHMNSLGMWESHVRGKRHLANLKKMPGDLPSKTKTVQVNKPALILQRLERERPGNEPIVGLKEIRETQIREDNSCNYQCFLCGSCHNDTDIIEHLLSLKHRTKYLDHIDYPNREVLAGMSDSAAYSLVREMCIDVEAQEGPGHPEVHVDKDSLLRR